MPDPTRTRLWLNSTFIFDAHFSTSLPSIWELYQRVFWRWADTHPHLKKEDFDRLILKAFKKCKTVEVSQSYRK